MEKVKFCKMVVMNGKHLVQMPDGKIIPHQVKTKVIQDCENGKMAKVKVTLHCTLEESKEE
jgi:hypothetical protein